MDQTEHDAGRRGWLGVARHPGRRPAPVSGVGSAADITAVGRLS